MSTINTTISASKLYLTTEHDVRSRTYDILTSQRNIIDLDGINNTQISFSANPGYTIVDAVSVMVSGLYLAQENNLTSLWQRSLNSHLENAAELAKSLGFYLNPSRFEEVFLGYIRKYSPRVLDNLYGELPGKYLTENIYVVWEKGVKAHQRLMALSPDCTFLTVRQWRSNLKKVAAKVTELRAEYDNLKQLDDVIEAIRKQADKLRSDYRASANDTKSYADLANLYHLFILAQDSFVRFAFEMEELQTFDSKTTYKLIKEINGLVPAETK